MNLISRVKNNLYKASQSLIRKQQKRIFNNELNRNANVIVMLVPDQVLISGGILSIYSFYYETKKLLNSSVFICTYANGIALPKYDWFNNDVNLISLDVILNSNRKIDSLIIHIPEYYVGVFPSTLSNEQVKKLKEIDHVHINVMNQNNELMLKPIAFNELRNLCSKLTITTAHSSYTTVELRQDYNVPVHLLSAWFEQTKIVPKFFADKKDILIISPDEHPMKEIILAKIKQELPHVEQIVIKNMRYDDFKVLELKAKWSISFGEGFDGYTIFPMLKGGIGFAVYNNTFFDEKYHNLKTFYNSYSSMVEDIVKDIKELDVEHDYNNYNKDVRNMLSKEYNYDLYIDRVKDFYKEEYTFA